MLELKKWTNVKLNDLAEISLELIDFLSPNVLLCFHAQMGSGKTTFIQQILATMGIGALQGSPTFSIVNEYESTKFGMVYHMDLYRIENPNELINAGIDELFHNRGICFIEWPENAGKLIPSGILTIQIEVNEDYSRTIILSN